MLELSRPPCVITWLRYYRPRRHSHRCSRCRHRCRHHNRHHDHHNRRGDLFHLKFKWKGRSLKIILSRIIPVYIFQMNGHLIEYCM